MTIVTYSNLFKLNEQEQVQCSIWVIVIIVTVVAVIVIVVVTSNSNIIMQCIQSMHLKHNHKLLHAWLINILSIVA